MARRRTYRPGDFLRQCARTGFTLYASDTKREWTGQIVRDRSYEARNAQEFVRGVEDHQAVYDPRPLYGGDNATDSDGLVNSIGPTVTTLTAGHDPGDTALTISSSTGFNAGNTVRVSLREGNIQSGVISSVDSTTQITLTKGLSGTATAGGSVQNISTVTSATGGF